MIDSILDALGYVGDSLDKAGPRPLRGLLAGKPRELASIVPFSDELGLTDPADIRTGRHVTDNFGLTDPHDTGWGATGMGLMADALIDPTALAGTAMAGYRAHKGLLNAARSSVSHRGSRLGFMDIMPFMRHEIGTRENYDALNNAADHIGPMHNPKAAEDALSGTLRRNQDFREGLMSLPEEHRNRLLAEIPAGSEKVAEGAEGPVLRTPERSYIKIQPAKSRFSFHSDEGMWGSSGVWPSTGRANIPEVLNPIRSNRFGSMEHGFNVEHLNEVHPLDTNYNEMSRALEAIGEQMNPPRFRGGYEMAGHLNDVHRINENLQKLMKSQFSRPEQFHGDIRPHLSPWDVRIPNLSLTPQGTLVIHDGGAVAGSNLSVLPFPTASQPTPELLNRAMELGAPHAVRDAITRALGEGAPGGLDVPDMLSDVLGPIHEPLAKRQTAIQAIEQFIKDHTHLLEEAMARGTASTPGHSNIVTPTTAFRSRTPGNSELRRILDPSDSIKAIRAAAFKDAQGNNAQSIIDALGGF